MTIVYGVKFFGAKEQIRKQLKEVYPFESNQELGAISALIAKMTLKQVENLF